MFERRAKNIAFIERHEKTGSWEIGPMAKTRRRSRPNNKLYYYDYI
jgi:hypothetical protein